MPGLTLVSTSGASAVLSTYFTVLARLHDVALASMTGVNVFRCCSTSSAVVRPSNIFPLGTFWGTPGEPSIRLRTSAAVTLQAQFRFRCYFSTTALSSLSAGAINTDAQRAHPTEIKGQSGRQYKIERVLQDKEGLLGRVFLATYVCSEQGQDGLLTGFDIETVMNSLS